MVSETDISYIAGLFDGEGCITYKQYMRKRKHQKKAYPTLVYKNGNSNDRSLCFKMGA